MLNWWTGNRLWIGGSTFRSRLNRDSEVFFDFLVRFVK